MKTAMIAMSGGVDSAVAARLMQQQGFNCHGGTMLLWDTDPHFSADAQAVCNLLGIPFHVLDASAQFRREVVEPFIRAYEEGLTPNPCYLCNQTLKFSWFLDRALDAGCDCIATGHYARLVREGGRTLLYSAPDKSKDQSYFLAGLNQHQLSHSYFPLGDLTKDQVRAIAEEQGFCNARKKDSQDICFVPDGDYAGFMGGYTGKTPVEGDFVDKNGAVLGRHKGIIHYTIGQRKGLGLGGGPWFVVKKNIRKNIIFVAHGWDTQLQYGHDFRLADLHFITRNPWENPVDVPIRFKVRHVDHFMDGTITLDEEGYHIHSPQPVQGIAPGQFGCIYDAEARICYGSGEIGIFKNK